jgi:hypothetical protein
MSTKPDLADAVSTFHALTLVGAEIGFLARVFDLLVGDDWADERPCVLTWQLNSQALHCAVAERRRTMDVGLCSDDVREFASALKYVADCLSEGELTPEVKKLAGLLAHREPGDLRARAAGLEALLKKAEVPSWQI